MKAFFVIFSVVAAVLGFVVDSITLVSWLVSLGLFASAAAWQIPGLGRPIDLETLALLVLLYTFLLFGARQFTRDRRISGISTCISGATIPIFFVWAHLFYDLDTYWMAIGSFIGVGLYCCGFFVILPLLYKDQGGPSLRRVAGVGIVLAPLAAAWLHEGQQYGWWLSVGLGLLLGNAGAIILLLSVFLFLGIAFGLSAINERQARR